MNEALNETRDLAATIGVRLDPPSHDSAPQMPTNFDPSSIAPSVRVQQPVSMRSEYLSSQIAEGRTILDTLERRLPALKELTSAIEERLSAPPSERSSRIQRKPLFVEEDKQPPIDASGKKFRSIRGFNCRANLGKFTRSVNALSLILAVFKDMSKS